MAIYFNKDMVNFDDDIIKVYKGRKIVWQGMFEQYFENGDDFENDFEWDASKKAYIGIGKAKGWKVRKVK